MNRIELKVEPRPLRGKGPARRLRAAGKIPAVFYGKGRDTLAISVDAHMFTTSVEKKGKNSIFDLVIQEDGKATNNTAFLKERHADAISGKTVHLDFIEISLKDIIEVTVPLNLVGKCIGVEKGGNLTTTVRYVRVACLPADIPESVTIDVTNLDIGHALHIQDLELPEGVESREDPELAIVTVVAPKRAELVEEEAAEEEGAEAEEGAAEGAEGAAGESSTPEE
jgi:large subunit ribosomal protein L25